MRMRKLGRGQSVVFVASGEITKRILDCCGKTCARDITVTDLLLWTIRETLSEMKRCIPLCLTQRDRHSQQRAILQSAHDESISPDVAKQLLEPEAQSIEQRYGFHSVVGVVRAQSDIERAKLEEFGLSGMQSAAYDEEQERELSPEIEREREVQRPSCQGPHIHFVHADLRTLVETGHFKEHSEAFQRAF